MAVPRALAAEPDDGWFAVGRPACRLVAVSRPASARGPMPSITEMTTKFRRAGPCVCALFCRKSDPRKWGVKITYWRFSDMRRCRQLFEGNRFTEVVDGRVQEFGGWTIMTDHQPHRQGLSAYVTPLNSFLQTCWSDTILSCVCNDVVEAREQEEARVGHPLNLPAPWNYHRRPEGQREPMFPTNPPREAGSHMREGLWPEKRDLEGRKDPMTNDPRGLRLDGVPPPHLAPMGSRFLAMHPPCLTQNLGLPGPGVGVGAPAGPMAPVFDEAKKAAVQRQQRQERKDAPPAAPAPTGVRNDWEALAEQGAIEERKRAAQEKLRARQRSKSAAAAPDPPPPKRGRVKRRDEGPPLWWPRAIGDERFQHQGESSRSSWTARVEVRFRTGPLVATYLDGHRVEGEATVAQKGHDRMAAIEFARKSACTQALVNALKKLELRQRGRVWDVRAAPAPMPACPPDLFPPAPPATAPGSALGSAPATAPAMAPATAPGSAPATAPATGQEEKEEKEEEVSDREAQTIMEELAAAEDVVVIGDAEGEPLVPAEVEEEDIQMGGEEEVEAVEEEVGAVSEEVDGTQEDEIGGMQEADLEGMEAEGGGGEVTSDGENSVEGLFW